LGSISGISNDDFGDDADDFSLDLNQDLFASIDDDLFDFVQRVEDLWFQFFDGGLNSATDVITKFLGSSLDFLPDITESTFCHVGLIFGRGDEFSNDNFNDVILDGYNDFLSTLDNGFSQLLQVGKDLGFEFFDNLDYINLDFVSSFLGSGLHFSPNVTESVCSRFSGISNANFSDDADDFSLDLNQDLLASIDDDLLDFVQRVEDLWFQLFDGGLNSATDIISKFLGSSLDFLPDITESVSNIA